jgi:hypothetical protein
MNSKNRNLFKINSKNSLSTAGEGGMTCSDDGGAPQTGVGGGGPSHWMGTSGAALDECGRRRAVSAVRPPSATAIAACGRQVGARGLLQPVGMRPILLRAAVVAAGGGGLGG